MIKRLENLPSEERLKELCLSILQKRRLRGLSFPVLKGWLQRERRLSLPKERTRPNKYKLRWERFHLDIRKTFFLQ